MNLFRSAMDSISDEESWAHISQVRSHIGKQQPEFDPRNYGYNKFSDLVKAFDLYELTSENQRMKIKKKK